MWPSEVPLLLIPGALQTVDAFRPLASMVRAIRRSGVAGCSDYPKHAAAKEQVARADQESLGGKSLLSALPPKEHQFNTFILQPAASGCICRSLFSGGIVWIRVPYIT